MGGVKAYLGMGDTGKAQNLYDRTILMLSGLDADFLAENVDCAVEIYLALNTVYVDGGERLAQILEEGYAITGEDPRMKEKLIEIYLQAGKEKTENSSYEEALAIYDRMLELAKSMRI